MYELIQAGANTYYIQCPAKMGLYRLNETEVCLIDSGNDKEAGKKVLKILDAQGWTLNCILNTHSHADHIGGNHLIQQRTGCPIYSVGIDVDFANHPILESSFLYGGCPPKPLRNKFLCAQPSVVQALTSETLPKGLELLRLDGHSFSMAAIKTDDDVWFLADCLTNETILNKYHVSFLYDVAAYLQSLHTVEGLSGKLFIPAHAEPTEDIRPLVTLNVQKTQEIVELVVSLCQSPIGFDDLLKAVFDHYGLTLDFGQHVLVGSTIRSYLSYLYDSGRMHTVFAENKLFWQAVNIESERKMG